MMEAAEASESQYTLHNQMVPYLKKNTSCTRFEIPAAGLLNTQ
jgi:hypothetical protein